MSGHTPPHSAEASSDAGGEDFEIDSDDEEQENAALETFSDLFNRTGGDDHACLPDEESPRHTPADAEMRMQLETLRHLSNADRFSSLSGPPSPLLAEGPTSPDPTSPQLLPDFGDGRCSISELAALLRRLVAPAAGSAPLRADGGPSDVAAVAAALLDRLQQEADTSTVDPDVAAAARIAVLDALAPANELTPAAAASLLSVLSTIYTHLQLLISPTEVERVFAYLACEGGSGEGGGTGDSGCVRAAALELAAHYATSARLRDEVRVRLARAFVACLPTTTAPTTAEQVRTMLLALHGLEALVLDEHVASGLGRSVLATLLAFSSVLASSLGGAHAMKRRCSVSPLHSDVIAALKAYSTTLSLVTAEEEVLALLIDDAEMCAASVASVNTLLRFLAEVQRSGLEERRPTLYPLALPPQCAAQPDAVVAAATAAAAAAGVAVALIAVDTTPPALPPSAAHEGGEEKGPALERRRSSSLSSIICTKRIARQLAAKCRVDGAVLNAVEAARNIADGSPQLLESLVAEGAHCNVASLLEGAKLSPETAEVACSFLHNLCALGSATVSPVNVVSSMLIHHDNQAVLGAAVALLFALAKQGKAVGGVGSDPAAASTAVEPQESVDEQSLKRDADEMSWAGSTLSTPAYSQRDVREGWQRISEQSPDLSEALALAVSELPASRHVTGVCLQALRHLACIPQAAAALVAVPPPGGVGRLVRAALPTTAGAGAAGVQTGTGATAGLATLAALAVGGGRARSDALAAHGCVEAAVVALGRAAPASEVALGCLSLLNRLIESDEGCRAAELLRTSGGGGQMLDLLRAAASGGTGAAAEVRTLALVLLADVTRADAARRAALADGAMDAVLRCLRGASDAEALHACGYALAALAAEGDAVRSVVLEEGGLSCLASVVKLAPSSGLTLLTLHRRRFCADQHKLLESMDPEARKRRETDAERERAGRLRCALRRLAAQQGGVVGGDTAAAAEAALSCLVPGDDDDDGSSGAGAASSDAAAPGPASAAALVARHARVLPAAVAAAVVVAAAAAPPPPPPPPPREFVSQGVATEAAWADVSVGTDAPAPPPPLVGTGVEGPNSAAAARADDARVSLGVLSAVAHGGAASGFAAAEAAGEAGAAALLRSCAAREAAVAAAGATCGVAAAAAAAAAPAAGTVEECVPLTPQPPPAPPCDAEDERRLREAKALARQHRRAARAVRRELDRARREGEEAALGVEALGRELAAVRNTVSRDAGTSPRPAAADADAGAGTGACADQLATPPPVPLPAQAPADRLLLDRALRAESALQEMRHADVSAAAEAEGPLRAELVACRQRLQAGVDVIVQLNATVRRLEQAAAQAEEERQIQAVAAAEGFGGQRVEAGGGRGGGALLTRRFAPLVRSARARRLEEEVRCLLLCAGEVQRTCPQPDAVELDTRSFVHTFWTCPLGAAKAKGTADNEEGTPEVAIDAALVARLHAWWDEVGPAVAALDEALLVRHRGALAASLEKEEEGVTSSVSARGESTGGGDSEAVGVDVSGSGYVATAGGGGAGNAHQATPRAPRGATGKSPHRTRVPGGSPTPSPSLSPYEAKPVAVPRGYRQRSGGAGRVAHTITYNPSSTC